MWSDPLTSVRECLERAAEEHGGQVPDGDWGVEWEVVKLGVLLRKEPLLALATWDLRQPTRCHAVLGVSGAAEGTWRRHRIVSAPQLCGPHQ